MTEQAGGPTPIFLQAGVHSLANRAVQVRSAMLESTIKAVLGLVPFRAPYPARVKALFGLFVASGTAFVVALVVAAPQRNADGPAAGPEGTAWLTINGVTLFGFGSGRGIRVTATENGIEFVYPTLPGVEWLDVGDTKAPQTFPLPTADTYTIRFAAELRNGRRLVSVEEHHYSGSDEASRQYALRELDQGQRAVRVGGEVSYRVTRRPPCGTAMGRTPGQ